MDITLKFYFPAGTITVNDTEYKDSYETVITVDESTGTSVTYPLPVVTRPDFTQRSWMGEYGAMYKEYMINKVTGTFDEPFDTAAFPFEGVSPLMFFTVQWDEFTVFFDPESATIDGWPLGEMYTQPTVGHRLYAFPTAHKDSPSETSSYVFQGWVIGSDGTTIVTADTLFTSADVNTEEGYIRLVPLWDIYSFEQGVVCYLQKTVDGVTSKLYLPYIKNISDIMTASLTEMNTMMFGLRNKFIIDMGTKQTFTLSLERVNPANYDDWSGDPLRFSNARWWQYFTEFVDFWQNNGKNEAGDRTGGFRFVLIPHREWKRDEPVEGLFPRIDKNVFLTGAASMNMTVDRLSFSLPLTVASMKAIPTVPTWSIILEDVAEGGTYTSEVTAPKGRAIILPGPPTDWANRHLDADTPESFRTWLLGDIQYPPGEPFPFKEYESPPVFRAQWKATDSIRVFFIDSLKDGINQTITRTYTQKTSVYIKLIGGGASGSSGWGTYTVNLGGTYYKAPGGGGGGACDKVTSHSVHMDPQDSLEIEVGRGGVAKVDETKPPIHHRVMKGVDGGLSKVTYTHAGTSLTFTSSFGVAPTISSSGDITYGGKYGGGNSASGIPKEDGEGEGAYGQPRNSGGGRGGDPSSGCVYYQATPLGVLIFTSNTGGSGGGGAMPLQQPIRIPRLPLSEDTTPLFPPQGTYLYDIQKSEAINKIVVDSSTVQIQSIGGRGWSDGRTSEDHTADAQNGYMKPGVEWGHVLTVGGGGGGVPAYVNTDVHDGMKARGSNGCVILYETILEED